MIPQRIYDTLASVYNAYRNELTFNYDKLEVAAQCILLLRNIINTNDDRLDLSKLTQFQFREVDSDLLEQTIRKLNRL